MTTTVPKATEATNEYFQYSGSSNPTPMALFQSLIKNNNTVLLALVASLLWQPTKAYAIGTAIISPNMKPGTFAMATVAGSSGVYEPTWPAVENAVADGSVTWKIIAIPTAKVASSGSYNDLSDTPAAYELPAATSTELGGVKTGSGVTNTNGTISVTKEGIEIYKNSHLILPDGSELWVS